MQAITKISPTDTQENNAYRPEKGYLFLGFLGEVTHHDLSKKEMTVQGTRNYPSEETSIFLFHHNKDTQWETQNLLVKEGFIFGARYLEGKETTLEVGQRVLIEYTQSKEGNIIKEISIINETQS